MKRLFGRIACWMDFHRYRTPFERAGYKIPEDLRPTSEMSGDEVMYKFSELNKSTCDRCDRESDVSFDFRIKVSNRR